MTLEDFVLTVRKMIDFHRLNFVERPVDVKIKTVCGLDLKTDETVDTNCIYITQKDEGG